MKKVFLILLTASLLLAGCGKQNADDTRILPRITYADTPAVSETLTPAPEEKPAPLYDADIPSKISELYIMDEGYNANAVAGLGDTLLAADLDEEDHQLVLAHYRLTDEGKAELTDRAVLLQGTDEGDVYQTEIRGISAGTDGCYYVLTGEAPRKTLRMDLASNEYTISENPDYNGRFRVLKYSTDGVLLDTMDYNDLPIDATGVFTACNAGKLLLFCFESVPESQQKDEFDFSTIASSSLLVLDFNTGEYDTHRYGMDFVKAACPYGENAVVYMERMSEAHDAGLFFLNVDTGEFEKINWQYTFAEADTTHTPYCFADGDKLLVNNQSHYGVFDPVTLEYDPILNSIPENQSAPFPEHPDYLDYPAFTSCCRIGEQTFVGSAMGSAPLYVVSPA